MLIQGQVQCLFVNITAKCGECPAAAVQTLTDSHALFHRFKASVNVCYIKVSGEAVHTDIAVWALQ